MSRSTIQKRPKPEPVFFEPKRPAIHHHPERKATAHVKEHKKPKEQPKMSDEENVIVEDQPKAEPAAGEGAEQFQAITVGNTIASTTTIDALFTACFATRSADLAATPVYTWAATSPPQINATWAAANVPATMMVCKFEVRNTGPANANSAGSSVLP